MPRFRRIPTETDAVQLTWQTWSEVRDFLAPEFDEGRAIGGIEQPPGQFHWGITAEQKISDDAAIALRVTARGNPMFWREGDWVLRDAQGVPYPCADIIFRTTYEEVSMTVEVKDMSKQQPSVGRIVHYQDATDQLLAAIITKVNDAPNESMLVSLTIFTPGGELRRNDIPWSEELRTGHWSWPALLR